MRFRNGRAVFDIDALRLLVAVADAGSFTRAATALNYTLAHMGERYPMHNVAFFCTILPRSTYERCGAISEDYGLGFFEDDDYCRKVEAEGLQIACAEDVFVHHHLSASFNKMNDEKRRALVERNKAIYEKKWGTWKPHSYRP